MCIKMLLPYIVMEISLVVLCKAKEGINYNKEPKLFVQFKYSSEASGWYEELYFDLYTRNIKDISANFVFERNNNVWRLLAHPKNVTFFEEHLIYKTDQSLDSLFQENFTNYKGTLQNPSRIRQLRFHSDEITTSHPLLKSKNKRNTRSRDDRYQDASEELNKESGLYPPVKEIYESQESEDIFKLFHRDKCSCTKLEILQKGKPPREYYRLDINRNLSDYCNLSNVQEYSTENRNSSFNINNNNSRNDKRPEEWKEETYVSDTCQLIYFDEDDDKWVAELKSDCSQYEEGILYMIWSEDSAPCIEYLPPPRKQTWYYYSFITVYDRDISEPLYIENCGGYYKKSIYEGFTVTCSSIPDGLS